MRHFHTKYCPKAKVCELLKKSQRELAVAKKRIKELENKLLEGKKAPAKAQESRLQN